MINKAGKLVKIGEEKAEELNKFCVSVFNVSLCSHTSGVAGQQDGGWGSKVPPTVGKEQVHEHLRNLNIPKSVGPGEMHPNVLRELFLAVSPHQHISKPSPTQPENRTGLRPIQVLHFTGSLWCFGRGK